MRNKGLTTPIAVFILGLSMLLGASFLGGGEDKFGAPASQSFRNILPFEDSTYEIGTTTNSWLNVYTDNLTFGTTTSGCLESTSSGVVWITGSACGGGGGAGTGNVSTSTTPSIGQVPFWTTSGDTPELLGSVATSSVTINSPLTEAGTPGYVVGGSGWTLDIDTSGAWSGTAGSLAANGANCSAGNAPLGVDASGAVEGCFDVWTEAENTSAAYISLSSLSATTPLIYNSSTGAFTFVGLATTSQPSSSNLLVSNGGAGVYGVATTSVTCSGDISCTGFVALGSASEITYTGAAGVNGYDFSYQQDIGYGITGSATTTKTQFTAGIHASSTSHFAQASTTLLTASTLFGNGQVLNVTGDTAMTFSVNAENSNIDLYTDDGSSYLRIDDGSTGGELRLEAYDGEIWAKTATANTFGVLDFSNILSTNKTFLWPNFSGDVLIATSSISVPYINATSTTATSTFAGGINTNILSCTEALETDSSGGIICGTDATGAGGGTGAFFELLSDTNFGAPTTTKSVVVGTTTVNNLNNSVFTTVATSSDSSPLLAEFLDSSGNSIFKMTNLGNTTISRSTPSFEIGGIVGTNGTPTLRFKKARGTFPNPSVVNNDDFLGSFSAQGYDGANYRNSSSISFEVDGTVEADKVPGSIVFNTFTDGTQSAIPVLKITSSQSVGIGTTSPYAKLSVVGEVVASHFTATTTSISRFAGEINADGGFTCSACIGVSDVASQIITRNKSVNLFATTTADGIATTTEDFISFFLTNASTISTFRCYADDTGTSTIRASHATSPLSAGTDIIFSTGATCGSDLHLATTTFSDATIPADSWVRVYVEDAEPTGSRPRVIYTDFEFTVD